MIHLPKKNICRIALAIILVCLLLALLVLLTPQPKFSWGHTGNLRQTTWRYNTSVSHVEEDLLVIVYDKLTGTFTSLTFSPGKEHPIRKAVSNERLNRAVVYDENQEVTYRGKLVK